MAVDNVGLTPALEQRLRAVEQQFLGVEGPFGAPERQALWPELAALYTALGRRDDAAVCWANALWDADLPPRRWTQLWVEAELALAGREVTAAYLDALLELTKPRPEEVRAVAACVLHATQQTPLAPHMMKRLDRVQGFIQAHEKLLPVRVMWLVWFHLGQVTGNVAAIGKARERLLGRLLNRGLQVEQDFPGFLRGSGEALRAAGPWMSDLHRLAQNWIKENTPPSTRASSAQTASYVDLIFAFGLARLGETQAVDSLLTQAKDMLEHAPKPIHYTPGGESYTSRGEAHMWLFSAFEYRTHQALAGKPHTGPLPEDQLKSLDHLDKGALLERQEAYTVDRLRKHSKVLEPDQRVNPYRRWSARKGEFEKGVTGGPLFTSTGQISTCDFRW